MLRMSFAAAALNAGFGVLAAPAIANAAPFKNCTAARDAGYENIPSTSEYYGEWLDRDHDGIGCKSN
jgi:Excalibur calcium-binding domain